jgi:tRNA threonylcarbamoyladenosine biosynthesis protein TsaE
MFAHSLITQISDPQETADIAIRLGSELLPGEVLLLSGDIGTGKTHFARHLIQSLQDVPEDVPSPSFTLVQSYETHLGEVWHADLYRISSPAEAEELGLSDAFDTSICLVEWPDRLGEAVPPDALFVQFDLGDKETDRVLTFNWAASRWAKRLKAAI